MTQHLFGSSALSTDVGAYGEHRARNTRGAAQRYRVGWCRLLFMLLTCCCFSDGLAGSLPLQHLVVFGDSLSDQGNARPFLESYNTAVYFDGRFSNGPTAVEVMAQTLGLTLEPSGHLAVLQSAQITAENTVESLLPHSTALVSANLGDNYAVATALAAGPRIYDLPSQVHSHLLAKGNLVDPDTLYVFMAGSNDVMDIAVDLPWPSTLERVMLSASRVYQQIEALIAAGGRHFLIVDVPNVSRTPALTRLPAVARWQIWWINNLFNRQLRRWGEHLQWDYPQVQVHFFSAYAWMANLMDNPTVYGLSNVTQACYFYGALDWNPPCSLASVNEYAFIDSIHPTAPVHREFGLALAALIYQYYGSLHGLHRQ